MKPIIAIAGCALVLACGKPATAPDAAENQPAAGANEAGAANAAAALGEGTSFPIHDAAGKVVGNVSSLANDPSGLPLTIQVTGLKPGRHGMHLHAVGKCEPPAFESAGAHWNPANKKHGHQNPEGFHSGDLGNLVVADDGTGRAQVTVPKAALGPLPDGLSLLIHADTDDEMTDPSGNSGARIACGLLVPAGGERG